MENTTIWLAMACTGIGATLTAVGADFSKRYFFPQKTNAETESIVIANTKSLIDLYEKCRSDDQAIKNELRVDLNERRQTIRVMEERSSRMLVLYETMVGQTNELQKEHQKCQEINIELRKDVELLEARVDELELAKN